jgi:hypothetical protein
VADLWDVQLAIDAVLVADGEYPVYDAVPPDDPDQPVPLPYLAYGEPTMQPDDELSGDGENDTLYIHGWSAQNSKQECLAMRRWLKGLLDHQTIAGAWTVHEEFAEVLEESEGDERLFHLITRWRVRTN